MMSSHHLEFLKKCEDASHVPPALWILLRPQIYASGTSPVEAKIARLIDTVQHNIIQGPLCAHYNNVLNNAQDRIQTVLSTISSSLPLLPPSQVASHKEMMERTKANIERKRTQLAGRTERKLDHQLSTQDKATTRTHTTPQDFHKTGPREKVATPRARTSTTIPPSCPPTQVQTEEKTGATNTQVSPHSPFSSLFPVFPTHLWRPPPYFPLHLSLNTLSGLLHPLYSFPTTLLLPTHYSRLTHTHTLAL